MIPNKQRHRDDEEGGPGASSVHPPHDLTWERSRSVLGPGSGQPVTGRFDVSGRQHHAYGDHDQQQRSCWRQVGAPNTDDRTAATIPSVEATATTIPTATRRNATYSR